MLGGDSGGSIVVGNYALGVNSGSNFDDCDDDGFGIGYAVSGGDYNATDLYGAEWELNVEVNVPSVDDEALVGESGTVLSGSVEAAGVNHTVDVTVEGVGDFEATVDADGDFAVTIDEQLEVGTEYTYVAQAFYGNYSSSAEAPGTFTVVEGEPEPEVAELEITSPSDGQTTSNARPPFEGTGEPGAEVTLSVGDDEFGAATITDEGAWEIKPDSDLPRGERFDATVTQVAGEDVQTATVSDLGIRLPEVTITAPEDGAEVSGDVVFEGTSFPGAEVGLYLEGEISASDDAAPALGAASDEFAATDEDEDYTAWEGDFEIDEDGNWSFTPDEALEDGEYTLTAMAVLPDGDAELSESEASVTFTVTTGGNGGDNGDDDEDLPDTGSSSLPMILIGVGLLAAGGGALALRARRNTSNV
nr:Ig-like domain-containing protein [Phytoactinopolyspora alkaliphila]